MERLEAQSDRTAEPPLRIGYVADDLYPGYGGQAVATHGHIEELSRLGHRIWVMAGQQEGATEPPPGVEVERLPVWKPGNKMTHYAWPQRGKIERFTEWAQLIHANTPTPFTLSVLRSARRRGLPTVVGFHAQEESMTLHFGRGRSLIAAALTAWYRYFYSRPTLIVAPTPFAARLAGRYTRRPVVTVSNGLRLPPRGRELDLAARRLREQLLGGDEKYLLTYLGRLSHEKRPQDLLDILAGLRRNGVPARLVLAGSGPLAGQLAEQARSLNVGDHVSMLGFIEEERKQALLAAADLFLMPSPTELQSLAALEAVSFGVPVAVANYPTSAVPEWVAAGECGLLYDPSQPARASLAIAALLADEERLARLHEKALALAATHDVGASAHELERIYRGLLE